MAKQEAAPRWLSSESTTLAPQRGTHRASTSRLRRRRASFPRNTPTPSGRMTPAGTSLAVERVDDAGAPAGDTSGIDLASETKTSVVSPQHANPKRTDDASTLAKDLLGVSLVPEITVQSVPDATPSPSVDQEVPSVFHPVPFRLASRRRRCPNGGHVEHRPRV